MTFFQKHRQPFASIAEVATYLGISQVTIRRRIGDGAILATRIGKQIRIRWSDVDAFVAAREMIPEPSDKQRTDLDGND